MIVEVICNFKPARLLLPLIRHRKGAHDLRSEVPEVVPKEMLKKVFNLTGISIT